MTTKPSDAQNEDEQSQEIAIPDIQTAFYVLKRILNYSRPYLRYITLGFVGIFLTQVLAIAIPRVLRFVIDRGIEMQDRDFMLQAGLLVVFLGVLRGITGFVGRYFTEAQSHRVAYDIRNDLYDKVQTLPFTYHDQARTGSLITRAISDVDEVQRFLAFGLVDGLNVFFVVLLSIAIMVYTSPVLAMIVLVPFIPLFFRSRRFAEFVENEWRGVMEHLSNLGDHLQENIVGGEVVRAFAQEDHEIKKFHEENERLHHQQLKVIHEWTNYIPFSALMISLSIVLTLVFGSLMEQNNYGGVTVGVIVQFNAYILLMSQPVRFVGFVIMLINQGIASGRRVFDVLDEPDVLMSKPDAITLENPRGVVKFENVDFRYRENLPLALKNITLTAEPDQVIAVIGRTGAGKSSLVNLISRFYDVSDGVVSFDGHDMRDLDLQNLRQNVGIVLQESLLFSATIWENIALGKPNATDEEVIAAAKAADAHNFILEFPDGYQTRVGERGITLSGGQKQRVAIARALLIDPAVLILDDATSSVDTQTEAEIQAALGRLMKDRTTFIVAQRLTSVIHATKILVLDKGEIVERGTHDELLALEGVYKEIYDLQLADQEKVRRETLNYDVADLGQLASD